MSGGWLGRLGRIRYRLLAVNLLVLVVPLAGLEYARIYERQLLHALEESMRDQAVLLRHQIESDPGWGSEEAYARYASALRAAAARTRLRMRVLDTEGEELVDSHEGGPPEGREPPPPSLLGQREAAAVAEPTRAVVEHWHAERTRVPIAQRPEVLDALAGRPGSHTRTGPNAVYLFVSEPLTLDGKPAGVIYVVRSTRPVLVGLHRVRNGLLRVGAWAVAFAVAISVFLAWTISRPLTRLSRAAKQLAAGDRDVDVPISGSGEVRELGESFRSMTTRLDARMQYMAEFSADVAHEFKSPLTSIRGAAELLQEGAALDPDARERFLRNILLDTERLDRLVSRLLELGRIDAAEAVPAVFELRPLLVAAVERSSTPEVSVALDYQFGAELVRARRLDLDTAIGNLLDNAVRHSPEGGCVRLEVREGGAADEVIISVEDEGPGVAPAMREKIFQRFFTTDAEEGGTGLGLAIVTSVAESHGGWVELVGGTGTGARFVLRLPIGCERER